MALVFRLALAHLTQTSKQLPQMADVIQASEELVEEEATAFKAVTDLRTTVPGTTTPTNTGLKNCL